MTAPASTIRPRTTLRKDGAKRRLSSGPALIIPYQIWEDRTEIIKVKVKDEEVPREVVKREYHTRHKVVLPADISFDAS